MHTTIQLNLSKPKSLSCMKTATHTLQSLVRLFGKVLIAGGQLYSAESTEVMQLKLILPDILVHLKEVVPTK